MEKLLISRKLPDAVMQAARARYDVTLRETSQPMDHDECVAALQSYDAILATLGDGFQALAFDAAGTIRARIIANFGVGYNHIDAVVAKAAGVRVTNTPGAVTDATADIAMTLMLMTARRAGEGERLVRSGAWTGWTPTQMLGLHATGKTVGIIGMGRIGQAIARRCHLGFGMKVVFHNRSPKETDFPAQQMPDLASVMGACDIAIVAVPGGTDTHHLIEAATLAAMQPHAVLINISRGDVLDEAALINALQKGQIAGAGLDVYEYEPKVPQALIDLENVVLLPHLGTAALEVREAMGFMALDNLIANSEGRALPNPV